jgi:hypothetical protein
VACLLKSANPKLLSHFNSDEGSTSFLSVLNEHFHTFDPLMARFISILTDVKKYFVNQASNSTVREKRDLALRVP